MSGGEFRTDATRKLCSDLVELIDLSDFSVFCSPHPHDNRETLLLNHPTDSRKWLQVTITEMT